jgi:hypothetical protein
MNSLSEIVAFTGVTGTAGLRLGAPFRHASMRSVGSIVPLLSSAGQNSMRAMILELQNLPPIGLEAELVGDNFGEAPFAPQFRIRPSSGVVLETVLNYFLGGRHLPTSGPFGFVDGEEVKPDVQIFGGASLGAPGTYEAVVTRTGITNAGVTVLEKRFLFTVRAAPQQPQHPPPQHPPHPPVTCKAEVDLSGFGDTVKVRVFGGGFLPPEPVDIIELGQVAATVQADNFGLYSVQMSVPTGPTPILHTVHAHGRTSGATSNNAGFTV